MFIVIRTDDPMSSKTLHVSPQPMHELVKFLKGAVLGSLENLVLSIDWDEWRTSQYIENKALERLLLWSEHYSNIPILFITKTKDIPPELHRLERCGGMVGMAW